jgi:hypothetical protein
MWMMNWKGCGRKLSWHNLRYYPGIRLEGLRKITTNLSGEPASKPRFEPGTSRIRGSVNYSTTTFGHIYSCNMWGWTKGRLEPSSHSDVTHLTATTQCSKWFMFAQLEFSLQEHFLSYLALHLVGVFSKRNTCWVYHGSYEEAFRRNGGGGVRKHFGYCIYVPNFSANSLLHLRKNWTFQIERFLLTLWSLSPSHFAAAGRPAGRSVCLSWCRAPSGTHDQILSRKSDCCSVSSHVASSLTRVQVCLLCVLVFVKSRGGFRLCEALGKSLQPPLVKSMRIYTYCVQIRQVSVYNLLRTVYTWPMSVQACAAEYALFQFILCINSSLVTWTVANLIGDKFKPVIFHLSRYLCK